LLSQVSHAQQTAKPAAAAAAAVPAAGSNPAGSLHEALTKSTPKFRGLLDVIKLTPASVPKNVLGTFFAPNDAVSMAASSSNTASTIAGLLVVAAATTFVHGAVAALLLSA
jgi:hypothetical protein